MGYVLSNWVRKGERKWSKYEKKGRIDKMERKIMTKN